MTYAHLFKAKGRKGYDLVITADSTARSLLNLIFVADRREARRVAAEFGALCWNF